MSERSSFETFRPTLSEVSLVKAAADFGSGDEVISLNAKRAGLDGLLLVLATDNTTHGPFVLNGTCARALYALLLENGFDH